MTKHLSKNLLSANEIGLLVLIPGAAGAEEARAVTVGIGVRECFFGSRAGNSHPRQRARKLRRATESLRVARETTAPVGNGLKRNVLSDLSGDGVLGSLIENHVLSNPIENHILGATAKIRCVNGKNYVAITATPMFSHIAVVRNVAISQTGIRYVRATAGQLTAPRGGEAPVTGLMNGISADPDGMKGTSSGAVSKVNQAIKEPTEEGVKEFYQQSSFSA